MITEKDVLDSLRHIIDPDLGRDIVSLGFVKDIKIDRGKVSFTLELTTPACPIKERFRAQCTESVKALSGVESVEVGLSAIAPKQRPPETPGALGKVDAIVAVSSCKGGVGKSTVAAHLARSMQRAGLEVGLLDADVYGPSVPTLFGVHHPEMYVRDNMLIPVEVDGLKVMSMGFLLGDSPAVLRGPIVSSYIQQTLRQIDWGHLDYLIIDLPPGTGDIQLTLVQQVALDGVIMVTTPQALSLVDVARGILMFEKVNVPVLGVVENMSYFTCDNCEKKHHIFGSSIQTLESRFGLATLAEFPVISGLSNLQTRDAGADIGPAKELADNVHRQLGKLRADRPQLPVVTAKPGSLHIAWPDGSESALGNRDVRLSCRCARCVDEMTGEQLLDEDEVPANIEVKEINNLGTYAVGITWSDGHSTGIFSWEHLREVADSAAA